jgi:large subunit ribosomal protein L5
VFPEIEKLKVTSVRGLDISITTTAKTDKECSLLLCAFKLPITPSRGVYGKGVLI